MYKLTVSITLCFSAFIIWAIYQANTGSSNPVFELVGSLPYGDKIGHLSLFGMLTLMFNLTSRCRTFSLGRINLYYGTAIVSIFVLLEELSQGLIPTRTLDIMDLAADSIGITLFSLLSYVIAKRFKMS
jgi:VanZ family protein